jgi:hypothetical protein
MVAGPIRAPGSETARPRALCEQPLTGHAREIHGLKVKLVV